MNITIDHILDLLSDLPKNTPFDYVSGGESKAKLISIDRNNLKVEIVRVNADGTEKNASMTPDILNTLSSCIVENEPFKFDNVLNGSGNVRSTMESIFAHTSEFYFCKIKNVKHLVWIPTMKKEIGLKEISISDVPFSENEKGTSVESIREEFKFFLSSCVKSTRGEKNTLGTLTDNSVNSYLSMLDKRKDGSILLFDYNPSLWTHIENVYNIVQPQRAEAIFDSLLNDPAFVQRDKVNNTGWRPGALNLYVLFLRARTYFSKTISDNVFNSGDNTQSLQKIFYGAPGTGKSHIIKELTQGESVIRTTFHPDSDYSTFVGAYKPTTQEEVVMTVIGTKAVPVENGDGSPRKEKKIVYEFVNQAFLQAYINAWKMYADDEQNPRKQYLIIEEINRGNCAQIFGDLFQLLDRNDEGFSEYPIKSDSDMEMHLAKAFKGMSFLETPSIAGISGEDVARKIRNGEIMILPPNLYIWATMNTSDQSLFPIDSAFKRRWEWKYLPIEDAKKDWKIKVNGNEYDWYRFLEAINKEVLTLTHSEDKQLGYFFAKAKNNIIDAETLVNKVYFYLWNDVFKDYDFESLKAFKKIGTNEAIAFKDFVDGKIVNEPMAEQVLINLEISKKEETEESIE